MWDDPILRICLGSLDLLLLMQLIIGILNLPPRRASKSADRPTITASEFLTRIEKNIERLS